jgi:hypothetical protein
MTLSDIQEQDTVVDTKKETDASDEEREYKELRTPSQKSATERERERRNVSEALEALDNTPTYHVL